MNNEDIIKKVNETQMQASNPKYSIWTAASAGSGKTTVALHRIAFLLYRLENLTSNNILIFSPLFNLSVKPKYAISGLPAGPYTVKNLNPVDGILYNFE